MKLPHTILNNVNHLAENVVDSIPSKIETWDDAKELVRVLDEHLNKIREEMGLTS